MMGVEVEPGLATTAPERCSDCARLGGRVRCVVCELEIGVGGGGDGSEVVRPRLRLEPGRDGLRERETIRDVQANATSQRAFDN